MSSEGVERVGGQAMTKAEIRAAQRLLTEHDAEHYDLPLDDPKVLACAFCGVEEDDEEAVDDLSWLQGHDGSRVLDRIQHEAGHPSPAAASSPAPSSPLGTPEAEG